MRRMIAAGPPAKRPPHIRLASLSAACIEAVWSRGWGASGTLAVALLLALPTQAVAADSAKTKVTFGQFIPATPPQPAPEVAFTDAQGNPASLADFRGKPAVVNLWATWCEPCLREMPSLQRLQAKLDGRLVVAAISEDRRGAEVVTPFVAKLGLDKIAVYLDPKNAVGRAFGVRGLPTSIVLDREGREVGRVEGAAEWDSEKMLALIEPLLKPADGREGL